MASIKKCVRLTRDRIDEFIKSKAELKSETLAAYRRAIEEFYEWLPAPKELTTLAAMSYGRHLATLYTKKATIRQRMSALSQLYKYFNLSLDGKEVVASVEPLNPILLTEGEYRNILHWAQREGDVLLRIALEAIYTLDLSGDTVIEMITVESARRGSVLIEEAGKLVEKPCIPSLAKDILAYAEAEHIQSGWVFVSKRGRGRMNRGTLSKKLRRAVTELNLCPSVSLSDVRRLGRKAAEEISARAIFIEMEKLHSQINSEEDTTMTGKKPAAIPILTKTTIEKAFDEADVGEFLCECVSAPEDAMEKWRDVNDINQNVREDWIHDYITECLRVQAPLIFPEAIEAVKSTEEGYAGIRRYIDLPINTPGVEVFFQDGAYHISSPIETEWITSADGKDPDCSRIACHLVGNLLQEAGMCFYQEASDFLGWKASLVPSIIVEFGNDDSLVVDENGFIAAVHPAAGAEEDEEDMVWLRGFFCCRAKNKEKLATRFGSFLTEDSKA